MKRDKINKMSAFLIAVILFFIAARDVKGECPSTSGKAPFAGVWSIWGFEHYNTTDNPWLKGAMVVRRWDQIELANNSFNFGMLDSGINTAITNGYEYIMIKIYVGPRSPDWIYEPAPSGGGVPAVTTNSNLYGQPYPYYLHSNYKTLFKRMINRVYAHIEAYPANIRNRIIGIQAPIGRSGDDSGYAGTPDNPQYNISGSEWLEYSKEMFSYYYNTYRNTNPPIVPIFHGNGRSIQNWLNKNIPHHWRKFANGGHCYQQSNISEMNIPQSKEYQSDGWAMLIRDESDYHTGGKFTEAPIWFMYWTGLHGLHLGLDFWNLQYINRFNDPEFTEGYDFFNEYAGYHSPSESHGAWIAFRDGLDAKDTTRFPIAKSEKLYPWWQQGSTYLEESRQRYLNIANDFSAYGAYQPADYIPRFWLSSCGKNSQYDVAWDTVPGNYKMYISQINSFSTSQGYWRQGPISQPFGRYARGFNNSAGKNNIYLDLDDNFFPDSPAQHTITVRVVYFDQGTGRWALRYNAAGNSRKIAYTQTKTNTGFWRERIVTLNDTYFNNAGPQGADIYLTNTDSEDDIFHMVEIKRSCEVNKGSAINKAPIVNAGPDQTITLPAEAVLNGTVTDDDKPNPPASVTTIWTKQNGPGTVTFGNAKAVQTTASFSSAGTYVLRLTANDSDLQVSDDVTVTVKVQHSKSTAGPPAVPTWRNH